MTTQASEHPLLGYYRLHAWAYDATRWSFLFGRDRLIGLAVEAVADGSGGLDRRVVEIGCGTGRNLRRLARLLPRAEVVGVDLCPPMIARARRAVQDSGGRVRLDCAAYGVSTFAPGSVDLVVFAYALSMFNPGFAEALDAARVHLRPGGIVAVVDFDATPVSWFKAWMGVNHVRMDGHLRSAVASRFEIVRQGTHPAYGGLWRYFCLLGRKPERG